MSEPTIMVDPATLGGIALMVARLAAEPTEQEIARGRALVGVLLDLQRRGAPGFPDPHDGLEDVVARLGGILTAQSGAEDARLHKESCRG